MSKNLTWMAGRLESIICKGSRRGDPVRPGLKYSWTLTNRADRYLGHRKGGELKKNDGFGGATTFLELGLLMLSQSYEVEEWSRSNLRKILIYFVGSRVRLLSMCLGHTPMVTPPFGRGSRPVATQVRGTFRCRLSARNPLACDLCRCRTSSIQVRLYHD